MLERNLGTEMINRRQFFAGVAATGTAIAIIPSFVLKSLVTPVDSLIETIKVHIKNVVQWHLFEPNDQYTRLQISDMVTKYLDQYVSNRQIYSYRVVCDQSNNTNEDLNLDVYIQPIRTIKYVALKFKPVRHEVS